MGQDSDTKLFAETRYHYMFTAPVRTTILPVTFGLREEYTVVTVGMVGSVNSTARR